MKMYQSDLLELVGLTMSARGQSFCIDRTTSKKVLIEMYMSLTKK